MSVNTHKNEQGMVAIMVTMLTMIVISLVVVAFAQAARREQRQALDRQLSSQAFYAAETGINDAMSAIRAGYDGGKENCDPGVSDPVADTFIGAGRNVIEQGSTATPADDIEYSCLLIDPAPYSFQYDYVDSAASEGADMSATSQYNGGSLTFNRMRIGWQEANVATADLSGCPSGATLTTWMPAADWPANCTAGVLRVDIVPVIENVSGSSSRTNLMNRTKTYFLKAKQTLSGGTIDVNAQPTGSVLLGSCNDSQTPRQCQVVLNFDSVPAAERSSRYYVRMRAVYRPQNVYISATSGTGNLRLSGGQKVIDSTGKANDVLKRLVVYMAPEGESSFNPTFAIAASEDICKQLSVMPLQTEAPSSPVSCTIPTAPPVTPPIGGGGGPAPTTRLRWTPPTLDPTAAGEQPYRYVVATNGTWQRFIRNASGGWTAQTAAGQSGNIVGATSSAIPPSGWRDVQVVFPSTGPVGKKDGLWFERFHDLVLIGGHFAHNTMYVNGGVWPPDAPAAGATNGGVAWNMRDQQRFLRAKDFTGELYLEGLRVDGDWLAEGINVSSTFASSVVTMQNVHIGRVRVQYPGLPDPWDHDGGDSFQTFDGPGTIRAYNVTFRDGDYQGWFLRPTDHTDGGSVVPRVELRNVNVAPSSGSPNPGKTYRSVFWRGDDQPRTVDTIFENFYGQMRNGYSFSAANTQTGFAKTVGGGNSYVEWLEASARTSGRIISGAPPSGDFAPVSQVGSSYVSPGYQ